MPRLDADFVIQATGARAPAAAGAEPFSGVSSDSRGMAPGNLFVALKGPNFDGHDFVPAALQAGAGGAMVQQGFQLEQWPEALLLEVPDTLRALGDLAAAWRREHSALLAAITGSNGKTTCKEMLGSIMAQRHRVLKNPGNFNNLIGLPLSLLQLEAGHSACVLEMGMNAPGEIARLTEIAAPEVGLISNVGPAHLGPLGSLEAVAAAKAELFLGLGPAATAVVNLDDPFLAPWAERLSCRLVTFALQGPADFMARDLAAGPAGVQFILELPEGQAQRVILPVPGRHNVANALGSAAAAWALGQGAEAIVQGLGGFAPVPGRLTLCGGRKGPLVVDDTYNANPASLAAALAALEGLAQERRRVLILGDMLELGPESPRLHFQAGQKAVRQGCRLVLALGEQAGQVIQGARQAGLDSQAAHAFSRVEDLLQAARRLTGPDDLVLIKGSRSMRMERVTWVLAPQGEGA